MGQYNNTLAYRNAQVVPTDIYSEAGLERRLFQATKLYQGHEDKAQWFPQTSVWPDPSLSGELATLQTNLNSYVNQNQLAFITGSKNIDTGWDAYVKGLDSTGMTRYLQIQQQAYDKYKAGSSHPRPFHRPPLGSRRGATVLAPRRRPDRRAGDARRPREVPGREELVS
jgi:putative aldouronate transport system substrate-binding protein